MLSVCKNKTGVKEASQIAYNPDAPSGHFQRHLNTHLPLARDRGDLYMLKLPGTRRGRFSQIMIDFFVHVLVVLDVSVNVNVNVRLFTRLLLILC